jgi:hypothetical protein
MTNLRLVLACSTSLAFLAVVSCGDNLAKPDARPGGGDSMIDNTPPKAPKLGMQIDRMGRPAINAALVGLLDTTDTAHMKKDAYNGYADPTMWAGAPVANGRSVTAEIAANLALLDSLDKGNAAIPGPTGCANQVLYNGNPIGGGTPGATSYNPLAGVLADDMLYVDTSKPTCDAYLSLEVEVATGGQIQHTQCGGRTPKHDVIDVSYSVLISGLSGFTAPPGLLPRLGDGVAAHTDITDTFPYFGPPH